MVLKLYTNHMSQPARAVTMFVRATQIPAEEIFIAIDKGEQHSEEFVRVNKFKKVPAIVHDDFHVAESASILRYLARNFEVPSHWYPTGDIKSMAKIDQFLDWQHLQLRAPLDRYLLSYIYPDWHVITDYPTPPSIEQMALNKQNLSTALDKFVEMWLGQGSRFVAGENISIADLLGTAEIEMMRLTDCNVREGRPLLEAYMDRVRTRLNPHYDQVNEYLYKVAPKLN